LSKGWGFLKLDISPKLTSFVLKTTLKLLALKKTRALKAAEFGFGFLSDFFLNRFFNL
jgi:hypothetical protein